MRLIRYVPLAVLTVVLSSNTSWSQVGSDLQSGPPMSGRTLHFPAGPLPSSADDASTENRDSALRQQYLDLAKAKAELMSDVSLKREIAETQQNINELRALQKLQEAQEILQSLAVEFPNSEAAVKATRMLQAVAETGLHAAFPDDIGPALNTAADEPFQRSSLTREIPTLVPLPENESSLPAPIPTEPATDSTPRVSFPLPEK